MVYSAQETLRVQRELEQLIERAKSRAARTIKACRAHLEAIDAGDAPLGETRNRSLYEGRLNIAHDHLAGVDIHFQHQIADIEYLERQRFKTMKLANEQLRRSLDAGRLSRSRIPDHAVAADVTPLDCQPAKQRPLVTSPEETLLSAFRSAETDQERHKVAAVIRSTPAALKAMNDAGNELWKSEQRRFLELQVAAREGQKGKGF